MLGRLARYLRMIGCDVIYPPACNDSQLIAKARSEGRVLLTRDRGIAGRASAYAGNPVVVEIIPQQVLDQLAQMADEGWITGVGRPRCSVCNQPLVEIGRQQARHLTAPFTLATQSAFLCCGTCNTLVWRGSHWRNFHASISHILRLSR